MASNRILYVCQEVAPYVPDTEGALLCRRLSQAMQERGNEIRTFMPRYGCINERRHQLHEVIRLSGMNLIIDDNDHQLIIKVASIPSARVQIYFIDNDDYFARKAILRDADENYFEDNDERAIFFARGVLETVKKLRWTPTVVHCHGWFSSIVPIYLKKVFADDPIFKEVKIVVSLYGDGFDKPLDAGMNEKVANEGVKDKKLSMLVSALSLVWTPYSLLDTNGFNAWASPSAAHPLGTDGTGADVLSWLMAGSRTNLMIAVLTVVVAAAIGLLLVAAMVSRSGALASTSVVVVDALISIPTVLIALILTVPFGASAAVVVAACGCAYGLNLARILRPSALLAARSAYVESALWSGASSVRVFFTHIVPNTLPVLCVQLSMSAGTSLLAEAGLTYLGVGVGAGVPSWGHSLSTSVKFISIYPMAVLWPGLVVTMVVVALNLFGDALRDALDPLTNPALREAA